jgi:hypothetical protein
MGGQVVMARRRIHYESAFEDFLRCRGWPYVAVDETKKAIFADAAVKSFDFLVYSETGPNLLVDVKGRKFPDRQGGRSTGRAWENWITRDDVTGLGEWEKVFGADFEALLVFAYWLQGPPERAPFEDVHLFKGRCYAFLGIALSDYLALAKARSQKWQTLTVPSADFSRRVADFAAFL